VRVFTSSVPAGLPRSAPWPVMSREISMAIIAKGTLWS
jgi:hypothetical protein